ncbi:MAG: DUF4384 domain-containing protein [Terracidiphilus sp.]
MIAATQARRIRRYGRILASLLVLLATTTHRMASQAANSTGLISIHLEQKQESVIRTVPQNTVFRNGNILRFRLTSRIAGYLYVVDKGTTGETATLFPISSATEGNNRIEPGQNMVVPANGDGWFEVSGPSGFDTIYLLVSASPIAIPPASPNGSITEPPQATSPPPPDLLPRCDDQIFKARGECIDASAGVAPLAPDAPVPRELIPLARTAARDIILTDDGDGVTVKAAPTAKLPLIYTFRLAHLQ